MAYYASSTGSRTLNKNSVNKRQNFTEMGHEREWPNITGSIVNQMKLST